MTKRQAIVAGVLILAALVGLLVIFHAEGYRRGYDQGVDDALTIVLRQPRVTDGGAGGRRW